ncbi:MAG: 6-pyruvoyl trahydropterin synthase family protein [Prevotella sp.]|jgi:6-pyruvoyltetrahydropterin/6-carboxytetrahydropterin synthase
MYYIKKKIEISASHHLQLSYSSKCTKVHGHNWHVVIYCRSKEVDKNGMVADFGVVKAHIHDKLDHADLNEVLPFNPTAENIARWIVDTVPCCYCAIVQESDNNTAMYTNDDEAPLF